MDRYLVEVNNLVKTYKRQVKEPGIKASVRSIFNPQYELVEALKGISFRVKEGEILGYIGPNGSGKTTTLKILSGVLYPTAGEVKVLGQNPQKRTREFLSQISFVMSARGILEEIAWDLPILDGLMFLKEIYNIPKKEFEKNLDELANMINICDLLNKPIRQLSHGQRMKAEIVASFLWKPKLIFLDEPTLGLDIFSQKDLRDFLKNYVSLHNSSVILASHYMKDIEQLATNVIMIDKGRMLYEGNLDGLFKEFSRYKDVKVVFPDFNFPENFFKDLCVIDLCKIVKREKNTIVLRIPEDRVKDITKNVINKFEVSDITITEQDLEDIVYEFYNGGEK